jgi:hypothetical protein
MQQVDAFDNRRAGVEQKLPSRSEALDSLFDDSETERAAELAAAMAIRARERVNEIRRIGDDQIEPPLRCGIKIALDAALMRLNRSA